MHENCINTAGWDLASIDARNSFVIQSGLEKDRILNKAVRLEEWKRERENQIWQKDQEKTDLGTQWQLCKTDRQKRIQPSRACRKTDSHLKPNKLADHQLSSKWIISQESVKMRPKGPIREIIYEEEAVSVHTVYLIVFLILMDIHLSSACSFLGFFRIFRIMFFFFSTTLILRYDFHNSLQLQ